MIFLLLNDNLQQRKHTKKEVKIKFLFLCKNKQKYWILKKLTQIVVGGR